VKRLYAANGITIPPDGATRREIDVLHPDNNEIYKRRGHRRGGEAAYDTLVWSWEPTQMPSLADGVAVYDLVEHEAWLERDPGAGVQPAIKQVSFVFRNPDLTVDEFRRHYREHIPVAWEHHIGCCRYVQNDVQAVHGASSPAADGFSELWFASVDDFIDRFYTRGDESVAAVREDTVEFIDFSRTFSLIVALTPVNETR
jgi:uncharacterized protein (TIGR02118 family)